MGTFHSDISRYQTTAYMTTHYTFSRNDHEGLKTATGNSSEKGLRSRLRSRLRTTGLQLSDISFQLREDSACFREQSHYFHL